MKKLAYLPIAAALAAFPAASQVGVSPSGHTHFGGGDSFFTISCLQGGNVVLQYTPVWSIDQTWNRSDVLLEYSLPDGARRMFNYNSANMTCLIEPLGQESVAVRRK